MAFWSKNLIKDVLTFSFFIRTIGGMAANVWIGGKGKAMNKSIAGFLEECKRSS